MTPDELKKRTKAFALRVTRLIEALPKTKTSEVVGRQLLRSGTSVGANYRAACCARSRAEFASKVGIVHEEVDESVYWMELLVESGAVKQTRIAELIGEAEEIRAMMIASQSTARKNARRSRSK